MASLLLSACASVPPITRSEFQVSQDKAFNRLEELYSYENILLFQERKKHLPKRMTGRQGEDLIIEFELYGNKYLLHEKTNIRIRMTDEQISSVEVRSYELGFFNNKRDKNLETQRMNEIAENLRTEPSNKTPE